MLATEAADIVDAIVSSIISDPAQFHLEINVISQQVTSYGGTGLSMSVTGGGSGSHTVGNQVSMSGASIEIARKQGIQGFENQMNAMLQNLTEISAQLRSQSPDKTVIQSILSSLKGTWVPGVIIGVIGNAVSKAIGL